MVLQIEVNGGHQAQYLRQYSQAYALWKDPKYLAAARDKLAATEQRFHKQILDVKTQVRAQYGEDSNELAALGLKKKSEKKSPTRRPRSSGPAAG